MPDVAIIGGSAAGCSAGMTARMRGMSAEILTSDGGSLAYARRIDNYPGLPEASGADLTRAFRGQAQQMGVTFRHGTVRTVMNMGESFSLLIGNEIIEARTVILAMGAKTPGALPGEDRLLGRGVSYCATCDGMFYRGKRVAVLAETEDAAAEANFLAGIAREVIYFARKPQFVNNLDARVTVRSEAPAEILGEDAVTGISAGGQTVETDGVFIFRDAMPVDKIIQGLSMENGMVKVDSAMRTSLPGVFAAGDIAGKPWQIAKAVGEGNLAALSAYAYLNEAKREG